MARGFQTKTEPGRWLSSFVEELEGVEGRKADSYGRKRDVKPQPQRPKQMPQYGSSSANLGNRFIVIFSIYFIFTFGARFGDRISEPSMDSFLFSSFHAKMLSSSPSPFSSPEMFISVP